MVTDKISITEFFSKQNAMEQQKHNAQEQANMIQNRHASMLKHYY